MTIGRNVKMPKTTRLGARNAQGRRRMPSRRWSSAIGASPRPKTSRSRRSLSKLSGGVRSACIVMAVPIAERAALSLSSRRRPGPMSPIGTGLRRCDNKGPALRYSEHPFARWCPIVYPIQVRRHWRPLFLNRRRELVLYVGGDAFEGLIGGDLAGDGLAQPIGDRNQYYAVIAIAL